MSEKNRYLLEESEMRKILDLRNSSMQFLDNFQHEGFCDFIDLLDLKKQLHLLDELFNFRPHKDEKGSACYWKFVLPEDEDAFFYEEEE